MVDLDKVGGLPVVMKELLDNGLLHGDCITCTGKTLAENLSGTPTLASSFSLARSVLPAVVALGTLLLLHSLANDLELMNLSALCLPRLVQGQLGQQDVVFPVSAPRAPPGRHIIVLSGNLCPGGSAVSKLSGKRIDRFTGLCVCYDDEREVLGNDQQIDCVLPLNP